MSLESTVLIKTIYLDKTPYLLIFFFKKKKNIVDFFFFLNKKIIIQNQKKLKGELISQPYTIMWLHEKHRLYASLTADVAEMGQAWMNMIPWMKYTHIVGVATYSKQLWQSAAMYNLLLTSCLNELSSRPATAESGANVVLFFVRATPSRGHMMDHARLDTRDYVCIRATCPSSLSGSSVGILLMEAVYSPLKYPLVDSHIVSARLQEIARLIRRDISHHSLLDDVPVLSHSTFISFWNRPVECLPFSESWPFLQLALWSERHLPHVDRLAIESVRTTNVLPHASMTGQIAIKYSPPTNQDRFGSAGPLSSSVSLVVTCDADPRWVRSTDRTTTVSTTARGCAQGNNPESRLTNSGVPARLHAMVYALGLDDHFQQHQASQYVAWRVTVREEHTGLTSDVLEVTRRFLREVHTFWDGLPNKKPVESDDLVYSSSWTCPDQAPLQLVEPLLFNRSYLVTCTRDRRPVLVAASVQQTETPEAACGLLSLSSAAEKRVPRVRRPMLNRFPPATYVNQQRRYLPDEYLPRVRLYASVPSSGYPFVVWNDTYEAPTGSKTAPRPTFQLSSAAFSTSPAESLSRYEYLKKTLYLGTIATGAAHGTVDDEFLTWMEWATRRAIKVPGADFRRTRLGDDIFSCALDLCQRLKKPGPTAAATFADVDRVFLRQNLSSCLVPAGRPLCSWSLVELLAVWSASTCRRVVLFEVYTAAVPSQSEKQRRFRERTVNHVGGVGEGGQGSGGDMCSPMKSKSACALVHSEIRRTTSRISFKYVEPPAHLRVWIPDATAGPDLVVWDIFDRKRSTRPLREVQVLEMRHRQLDVRDPTSDLLSATATCVPPSSLWTDAWPSTFLSSRARRAIFDFPPILLDAIGRDRNEEAGHAVWTTGKRPSPPENMVAVRVGRSGWFQLCGLHVRTGWLAVPGLVVIDTPDPPADLVWTWRAWNAWRVRHEPAQEFRWRPIQCKESTAGRQQCKKVIRAWPVGASYAVIVELTEPEWTDELATDLVSYSFADQDNYSNSTGEAVSEFLVLGPHLPLPGTAPTYWKDRATKVLQEWANRRVLIMLWSFAMYRDRVAKEPGGIVVLESGRIGRDYFGTGSLTDKGGPKGRRDGRTALAPRTLALDLFNDLTGPPSRTLSIGGPQGGKPCGSGPGPRVIQTYRCDIISSVTLALNDWYRASSSAWSASRWGDEAELFLAACSPRVLRSCSDLLDDGRVLAARRWSELPAIWDDMQPWPNIFETLVKSNQGCLQTYVIGLPSAVWDESVRVLRLTLKYPLVAYVTIFKDDNGSD